MKFRARWLFHLLGYHFNALRNRQAGLDCIAHHATNFWQLLVKTFRSPVLPGSQKHFRTEPNDEIGDRHIHDKNELEQKVPDEQQRIVGSGFDGFIAKPISIKPFLSAVERALSEGRAK